MRVSRPLVLTLGVFDGVHLGHRAVLGEAVGWAKSLGGEAKALTFDPHPVAVIRGIPVKLLCTLKRRLALLESLGVEGVVERFDRALAGLSAEAFLKEKLAGLLHIRGLVLGYDSHFGHDRQGDAALAARLAPALGFEVRTVAAVPVGGRPVSSRRIREDLQNGNLEDARACLGRPWALEGRVVKGDARGRRLGFPTANLDVGDLLLPKRGVYAGKAQVEGRTLAAAVNVGVRPTVKGEGLELAEVYLLDWAGDLYGKELSVDLLARLRDERHFESLEALKAQLAEDVARAREVTTL